MNSSRISSAGFRTLHALSVAALLIPSNTHAQHGATSPAAADLESDARKLQLDPLLVLRLWAAEPQLVNPVAFSVAPIPGSRGVEAFVAETHRYGISVFDITQRTPWLLNDLSLRSTADRSAFLLERFATNAALLTKDSEIVRRIADQDGDARAEASSVFADGFRSELDGTAAGILAHGTNVWFANIPNLWRLSRSAASNGIPARTLLAHGAGVHIGVTGHDLHGLILGPDQRLYASFGDRGLSVTNQEGLRIHAPDTGGVVRCNPDGSDLTLFCSGLRNPQELAFDHAGNLFTVDNDTAGADPCRVLHLVEGADYGWRAAYQHMKGFGPWVQEELWRGDLDGILPAAGTVSQGPAGLTYYPGTGFGDRFAGQFLHCDFPGGVWSFRLKPRDGSFVVDRPQKLIWNCWPTDVEFGPDGALYLLDWVAGWGLPGKGRIYRITPSPLTLPTPTDTHERLASDLTGESENALVNLLAHADYRVRLEAQWELARRGRASLPALAKQATDAFDPIVVRHALWGIGQILRRQPPTNAQADEPLMASLLPLLTDTESDTVIQALRLLGEFGSAEPVEPFEAVLHPNAPRIGFEATLTAVRIDAPKGQRRISAVTEDPYPEAERAVYAPTPWSGRLTISAFRGDDPSQATPPFEAFARSLAGARLSVSSLLKSVERWQQDARYVESRRLALLALRRRGRPEVARFLADPSPRIVLEATRAIHDLPILDALPAVAALLNDERVAEWSAFDAPAFLAGQPAGATHSASRRSPRDQILRRALNAHFRLGHATNAAALVAFAARDSAPASLRAEALFLLSRWEVHSVSPGRVPVFPAPDPNHGSVPSVNPELWPGWFDRVTGAWRPITPRAPAPARSALVPHLDLLVASTSTEVTLAALEAAELLRITSASHAIISRLTDVRSSSEIRARALNVLAALTPTHLSDVVLTAFGSGDPLLEAAAVPFLDRLQDDRGSTLITNRLTTELNRLAVASSNCPTPRLAQALVTTLARSAGSASEDMRAQLARRLAQGTLPPALELEVLEILRTATAPDARAAVRKWENSRPPTDPLAAWYDVFNGGDASRGATLFTEKPETQCLRCHQVGGAGGTVGPALDGVGKRLTRAQLLESIVLPNATVTAGFESAMLTLIDGRELFGSVRSESANELILISPEDGEVRVTKDRIRDRRKGLSAMPEGLADLVSRRELRDLIEYLASLK